MKLINERELGLDKPFFIKTGVSRLVMGQLGIYALNNLYSNTYTYKGVECASSALKGLNIKYNVSSRDIKNIPVSGPSIVIANHPSGILDGILLIDLLGRYRDDIKFMGSHLLERLEPLKEFFLSVNPFENGGVKNISGLRKAKEHIDNGGMLVIFPAGEVSTCYRGLKVEDKQWSTTIIKFLKRANQPITSIHINASNSVKFHISGKIHPILRTIRLPLELMNKQNKVIDITIGSQISTKLQDELSDNKIYGNYLRASTYYLQHRTESDKQSSKKNIKEVDKEHISDGISGELLERELSQSEEIIRSGEYSIHCFSGNEFPALMHEIGRLREISFREIGEGTNKKTDTDIFDNYYYQLIIWDNKEKRIVGGYRVGLGAEIMEKYGIKGFYTNTLFSLGANFESIADETIELGRSFIVSDYQRKPTSLMLLWKGIMSLLLKYPDYKHLVGPVSISGSFNSISKRIMISLLKEYYFDKDISDAVHPRYGIKGLKTHNINLLKGISNIDLIDRLIKDIEPSEMAIPVLIKKYIQLNGKILAFNIDPEFNESLDAFIFINIEDIPANTLQLLSKEMNKDNILDRFSKTKV